MSEHAVGAGPAAEPLDVAAGGSEALLGMATLGKTALALALVIAMIIACRWLLQRLGPKQGLGGNGLKVVASTAVGNRERVVVVAVQGRWLVLGVGGGQVTHLQTLDAPAEEETSGNASPRGGGFADRLAASLTRRRNGRSGEQP